MAPQLASFVFTLLVAYTSANNKVDIDGVDFLLGIETGVKLYHSGDNYTYYDTLMNTSNSVWSVDYHFSKHLIFAWRDRKLFKTTLEPRRRGVATTPILQLIKQVSWCNGFAVDWVHDLIYWADCDRTGAAIMTCGLDGKGDQTVLLSASTGYVHRMEIDPYSGVVFWTGNNVIQSVETSGEGFNPELTDAYVYLTALALDLRMRRVYCVEESDQSLYSMNYTGGEKVKHFSVPQLFDLTGLSILGDKVFWAKYDFNMGTIIYKICKAQINLTQTEDVKLLIETSDNLCYIRVMHPSLQRLPKMDPCLEKGCTHSCVATSSRETSAKCECPLGQALNNDGVSCHAGAMFFLSILLIVSVMVTSLVCLGYKYWSLLQSKFGIPYSRSQGREGGEEPSAPIVYRTEEDNVNII